MAADAEAGAHDAGHHRFAHQELLRALSALVVVIDDTVIGRLEAVELLGFTADGKRGEQHVVAAVGDRRLVLAGVKHLEGIAGLHLALEIDVVGVDADQVFDDRARNLVAQRGLKDALIERHAGGIVFVVLVFGIVGHVGGGAADVDGNVFAGIGQRHHGVDRRVAGDDDADRLQTLAAGNRRQQNAQFLAFLDAAVAAARSEQRAIAADLFRRGAEIAQYDRDACRPF